MLANRTIIDALSLAVRALNWPIPSPLKARMVPKHVRYQAALRPDDLSSGTAYAPDFGRLPLTYTARSALRRLAGRRWQIKSGSRGDHTVATYFVASPVLWL